MLYLFLLILILVSFFQTPVGKGILGEMVVRLVIGRTIVKDNKEQYVLNNVMIQTDERKTSQIDHILINHKGVFVIETKNYSGRIYGRDNQLEWTQVLNYGKVKNRFYNPVKQNATHIYRLKEILGDDMEVPFFSTIVFLKNNIGYINSNNVFNCYTLKKYIDQQGEHLLTSEQMQKIYNIIKSYNDNTFVSMKEHISNINDMKEGIRNHICPRCGGTLITRYGKRGSFMGCTNFPRCRFTTTSKK